MIAYFRLFFYAICCMTFHLCAADLQNPPLKFEIVAENNTIQPGKEFTLALHMQMEPTWHIYWKNPGDSGAAPQVKWKLPEGFTLTNLQWPVPEKLDSSGMISFGYEKDVVLLATIKAPASTSLQTPLIFEANVQWIACSNDTCLPGNSSGQLSIEASTAQSVANPPVASFFMKARQQMPVHPIEATAVRKDGVIEFIIHLPKDAAKNYSNVYFFPEIPDTIDHRSEMTLTPSDQALDHYTVAMRDLSSEGTNSTLKGVLVLGSKDQRSGWDVDVPVYSQGKDDEAISMAEPHMSVSAVKRTPVVMPQAEITTFSMALLFALIGGMILNLMPCVLPIISIKILSFVQMTGNRRWQIFEHGLFFSLGVLVSFWALAGLLLSLQAYGQVVGWGFQLQEPLFVAALAALLLVFAMSMFGVFEMGAFVSNWAGEAQSNATSGKFVSSFLSGVLATAVATPCTGPFLGSAVGYAVTLDSWHAMGIFTAVGLGMALPYLFLSAFPGFLKWLPRPGSWMTVFKQLMGFLMMAAVLWLIWVFGAQTNSLALIMVLAGLFLIAFATWVFGTWGNPIRSKGVRTFGLLAAIAFGLVGSGMIYLSTADNGGDPRVESSSAFVSEGWEPYSPERVAELQKQGIPVFIDFTAKWCLICQANHLVLSTPQVEQMFLAKKVVKMKADWTKNDPTITQALRSFGRNSVPLYLLYSGSGSETPKILPQVLTPDIIADHVKTIE